MTLKADTKQKYCCRSCYCCIAADVIFEHVRSYLYTHSFVKSHQRHPNYRLPDWRSERRRSFSSYLSVSIFCFTADLYSRIYQSVFARRMGKQSGERI